MISKIQQCIAGISLIILAFLGTWLKGKQAGRQQAEAQHNEEIIEAQQRITDAGHLSRDDVAERLQRGDF